MGIIIQNGKQYFPVYNDTEIKALPTVDTASGSIATFDTDMTENFVEVKCQIVAQQSGSGTPSPDNVRPITVYNSLTLGQDANYDKFLDFNQLIKNGNFVNTSDWTNFNATLSASDNEGTITVVTGQPAGTIFQDVIVPDTHICLMSIFAKLETATVGSIRTNNTNESVNMTLTSDYVQYQRLVTKLSSSSFIRVQIRADGDGKSIKVKNVNFIDLTQCFGSTIADEIYQMEQQTAGSGVAYVRNLLPNSYYDYTASTIETLGTANADGTGNTYNIPFGQTVANGVIDVTTGKLRVTHEIVDLGSLNYSQGFSGFYTTGIKDFIEIPSTVADSQLLCSIFSVGNTANNDNMYIQFAPSYLGWVVFLPSTSYATASDFKTAMSGIELVYKLATPQEIQLDSTQITALLNENNIWCDTGDTEVKYLLSVGKKIS